MSGPEFAEPDAGRLEAHGQLPAAVHAAGAAVPCKGENSADWSSPRERVQLEAAVACAGCRALAACAGYVSDYPETGGVWAGFTENQRKGKRK